MRRSLTTDSRQEALTLSRAAGAPKAVRRRKQEPLEHHAGPAYAQPTLGGATTAAVTQLRGRGETAGLGPPAAGSVVQPAGPGGDQHVGHVSAVLSDGKVGKNGPIAVRELKNDLSVDATQQRLRGSSEEGCG